MGGGGGGGGGSHPGFHFVPPLRGSHQVGLRAKYKFYALHLDESTTAVRVANLAPLPWKKQSG